MASIEVFTGTVVSAGWREESMVDAYWITLDTTDHGVLEFRGNDRLNVFPVEGQRIRIAGSLTPKGHYRVRMLRDETDPASQMVVQVEVL